MVSNEDDSQAVLTGIAQAENVAGFRVSVYLTGDNQYEIYYTAPGEIYAEYHDHADDWETVLDYGKDEHRLVLWNGGSMVSSIR